jgi:hypothetical protein
MVKNNVRFLVEKEVCLITSASALYAAAVTIFFVPADVLTRCVRRASEQKSARVVYVETNSWIAEQVERTSVVRRLLD